VSRYMLSAISLVLFTLPVPVGASEGVDVLVSIPDLQGIVEAVGGPDVHVSSIMPPGGDPHSFTVTQETMERILEADLVVLVNSELLSYERNILTNYPDLVHTDFADYEKNGASLSDFPGCPSCAHGYWLKISNGAAIAETVAARLSEIDPAGAQRYQTNLEVFLASLNRTSASLEQFSREHGLYGSRAVSAVPGVNYILENMGISVGAQLLSEGAGYVSGSELTDIEKKLSTGEYMGIVCPVSMKDSKPGDISRQISQDTGAPVVYVVFIAQDMDYIGIHYYNAAALTGLSGHEHASEDINTYLLVFSGVMAVLAAGEAYLIYRYRREAEE